MLLLFFVFLAFTTATATSSQPEQPINQPPQQPQTINQPNQLPVDQQQQQLMTTNQNQSDIQQNNSQQSVTSKPADLPLQTDASKNSQETIRQNAENAGFTGIPQQGDQNLTNIFPASPNQTALPQSQAQSNQSSPQIDSTQTPQIINQQTQPPNANFPQTTNTGFAQPQQPVIQQTGFQQPQVLQQPVQPLNQQTGPILTQQPLNSQPNNQSLQQNQQQQPISQPQQTPVNQYYNPPQNKGQPVYKYVVIAPNNGIQAKPVNQLASVPVNTTPTQVTQSPTDSPATTSDASKQENPNRKTVLLIMTAGSVAAIGGGLAGWFMADDLSMRVAYLSIVTAVYIGILIICVIIAI
jgi:hypothetical protein